MFEGKVYKPYLLYLATILNRKYYFFDKRYTLLIGWKRDFAVKYVDREGRVGGT